MQKIKRQIVERRQQMREDRMKTPDEEVICNFVQCEGERKRRGAIKWLFAFIDKICKLYVDKCIHICDY